jgi:serine phosphatase RsbU (regulator of sigma subunit)/pSer/pThr/pTyr-binding forkhead associated (FHA) protein
MIRLLVVDGPEMGREESISEFGVIIGRQQGVGLTLDGSSVSRRHARVYIEDGVVWVEDLGSSNGSFINEVRFHGKKRLTTKDTLRIGAHFLRIDAGSEEAMTIQSRTAAATSNSELYRENAAHKLQALLQLAHNLGHSLEAGVVLQRLVDQLLLLFPAAERVLVSLREGGEALGPQVKAIRNRVGNPPTGPVVSRTVLREVFEKRQAVLVEDAQNESRFASSMTLCVSGTRSLICVPLQRHNGEVFGALQLDHSQCTSPFTSEDLYLATAVALMVSPVLENAQLHQELLIKERMERELALAREVQLGYLPRGDVALPGGSAELFAELHPALEVSGDFYDYFSLDDHRVAFAVADVSGKGMSAALFMTMVRALTRHLFPTVKSPVELLARLNDAIAQDNPNFLFVTVACGIFDGATGQISVAHGGHPPVVIRRADGRVEVSSVKGAPLLGIDHRQPLAESLELQLNPGDSVFVYTDGITESPGAASSQEMYGLDRFLEAVRALAPDLPLAGWSREIFSSVNQFSGDGPISDDRTLLIVKRPQNPL